MNVQMPGYRINEYRLVIPIAEAVQEKIESLRKSLHEKYKVKLPFQLSPCLTVATFHSFEQNEPRLLERLQDVAMGHRPFKVELQNFSAYPSHTIYINVETKSPFNELVKAFKRIKWLMNVPEHEPHFITEPHLIVAQKLKPMQFINMWMQCEHSVFSGRFVADAMLLLKRNEESSQYQTVRRMEFMSLPMEVKQGVLFG